MKKLIKVYICLLKLNFAVLLAYRAAFIGGVIATLGWSLFSVVSILILTWRSSSFYGWNKDELLLLTCVLNILLSLFHMLFSKNFERFSNLIHLGEFDALLVKPIDSQFLISFWFFRYSNFFRLLAFIPLTYYLLGKMGITITILNLSAFIVLLLFGLVCLYSIWFIASTLIIWFTRLSNIVDFLYTVNVAARYPRETFRELPYFLFLFILPFTFIVITPSKVLMRKAFAGDIFGLILVSFILFFISRYFWKFALKYYSSASS